MKRILTLFIIALVAVVCNAASPSLACAKIFERKDLRAPGRDIVKINQPGNYFRSVTADNDKKLQKEIRAAVEQDMKKASNIVERYNGDDDEDSIILNLYNNGYLINIGFYWDNEGYVRLFIQANPGAFE